MSPMTSTHPRASESGGPTLDASVIIPTYQDWAGLGECLAHLADQDVDPSCFEVIVGNNNPARELPDDLEVPAGVRFVWEPTPGSYAARNAAVAASSGRVLFFTDADCRPTRTWISRGLQLLEADAAADRLAGHIRLTSPGDRWGIPELYDRLFNLRQARYVARGYGATAYLVVRRTLFDRVGPFDASLYSSGDKEWNRRAGALGSAIRYAEDLVVEHGARATFEEHARKRARVTKGRYMMRRSARRSSGWSQLRYHLPSLSAAKTIFAASGMSLADRLSVWRLDRRLRRVELETLRRLEAGTAEAHR